MLGPQPLYSAAALSSRLLPSFCPSPACDPLFSTVHWLPSVSQTSAHLCTLLSHALLVQVVSVLRVLPSRLPSWHPIQCKGACQQLGRLCCLELWPQESHLPSRIFSLLLCRGDRKHCTDKLMSMDMLGVPWGSAQISCKWPSPAQLAGGVLLDAQRLIPWFSLMIVLCLGALFR